jgi:tripartite-type tricarboxylate transporter receptor subunit TctC
MQKKFATFLAAAFTLCRIGPGSAEDAVAQFYHGKTVTILVGSQPGGGYDTYARLLARYLGKYIPGRPNIVVANMDGAGSEIAAGYVARVAPKDGTYIVASNQNQPLDSILQDAGKLNYDPSLMNYLGSAATNETLCIVRSAAPVTRFDDMLKTQLTIGGVAANVPMGYEPLVFNKLLGTKFKVVLGYSGSRDIILAMSRGEIDGLCGIGWASLTPDDMKKIEKGEIKIAVQANDKGVPELNKMGVPLTVSYAHSEEQRRILEIIDSQEIFARPYFVAEELPADRLQALRHAFMQAWADPDLLANAAKMHLAVDPMSGEEIQSVLQKIYASPPALLHSAREAIEPK